MNVYDIFWLAFKELSSRKLVASLAIIAVMIGVASVTLLVSFTQGVSSTLISDVESLGPNTILILPFRGMPITDVTVNTIETLPDVEAVYPVIEGPAVFYAEGQPLDVTIIGINNISSALIGNAQLVSGTLYPPVLSPYAVIGYQIANPAPGVFITPGTKITLILPNGQSVSLNVIGILSSSVSSPLLNTETSVFVPLQEAEVLFNRQDYSILVVKTYTPQQVSYVSNLIQEIYGNDISVITVQSLVNTVSTITNGLGMLLIIIASISLLVAAIGIAAIMMVKVSQRTKEIGIFKTLGMTTNDVLLVFLAESMIIGIIGGVLGIVLSIVGIIVNNTVQPTRFLFNFNSSSSTTTTHVRGFNAAHSSANNFFTFKAVLSPEALLISFIIAILVSLIAGIYPAWRASRLTVIEAIRRE
ncbi:MAG: ABC transporter permease [Sulfolobaceae archaeon]|nr:ABC transporter permease [Sulfolobaceae archaeon]